MIKRVLIVDDDVDFCQACANFLAALGYEVKGQNSEDGIIGVIRGFNPDIIFLDVVMKTQESGFTMADEIYADTGLRSIPLFFLTGYFKKATLAEREEEIFRKWPNVKGIIDKPVKPGVLLELIRAEA
ncbi:MAG: response regulator [Candidatus Omnitrophica bacterium]|nr:response regulator [Candidatus Omnitrophota bacterium]